MRADAGLSIRTWPASRQGRASRQDQGGATRDRVLLAVGAAVAAIAYLTAIAGLALFAVLLAAAAVHARPMKRDKSTGSDRGSSEGDRPGAR